LLFYVLLYARNFVFNSNWRKKTPLLSAHTIIYHLTSCTEQKQTTATNAPFPSQRLYQGAQIKTDTDDGVRR
jgi:hypothetical protein